LGETANLRSGADAFGTSTQVRRKDVVGASVNLAARLESLNKTYGTAVLVSENIKRRAEPQFLFCSVDQINPKGFAAKFDVFELRDKRENTDQAELDFCRAWEDVYPELSSATPPLAGDLLVRFLQYHPGDSVAQLSHGEPAEPRTRY
jgi:adenylate cyclase